MGKSGRYNNQRIPIDGSMRHGQIVGSYGPGSMLDLLHHSGVMQGTDEWRYHDSQPYAIKEARLQQEVAKQLEKWGQKLNPNIPFIQPPTGDDQEPNPANGIPIVAFPKWLLCTHSGCRALVRMDHQSVSLKKDNIYYHQCDDQKKASKAVPIRFVAACKRGHLDDFPWHWFAHQDVKEPCVSKAPLELKEGKTGDFSEIYVVCKRCKAKQPLALAMGHERNPPCTGHRPWLSGQHVQETCNEKIRLLVRTASNTYFPMCISALSIPDKDHALPDLVRSHLSVLGEAENQEEVKVLRKSPQLKVVMAPYSAEAIWQALLDYRHGEQSHRKPLLEAEYDQLTNQPVEQPGEYPDGHIEFHARTSRLTALPLGVDQLVVVRKLREVRVQLGFTRLEPLITDVYGEFDVGVKPAFVTMENNQLPAVEIFGEGIFFTLNEQRLQAWEQRASVVQRGALLERGFQAYCETLQEKHQPSAPSPRFYLLHTLAHLLITSISLECGYAASAIRERIYCSHPKGSGMAMAGILLSTGASGSEGTLGGLVDQANEFTAHIQRAWDSAAYCSHDPVCANHDPSLGWSENNREGAACHGCLFIAESSCAYANHYLDRALVVPVMGQDSKLAFFQERP